MVAISLMALKREDRFMEETTSGLEKSVLPLVFVQHAFNYQMLEKIVQKGYLYSAALTLTLTLVPI